MRFLAMSLLLIASAGLSACANLSTVYRTTLLPSESSKATGKAIHLDAQQRLVLVRAKQYCAEPSPDALASYAAALGLGLGQPGAEAAHVAQALQSTAASIGLRTQSITLMRDALYRICEATANGVLGDIGAATALFRSQDLTAVVLATEQLTGTVAAAQVILTSEARAKASTALIETQKRLKAAEKEVTQAQEALSKAKKAQTKRKATVQQKQKAVEKAQAALDKAEAGTDNHAKLSEELTTKQQESAKEQAEFEKAKKEVESLEAVYQEAVKNRDAIQDGQEETRIEATTEGAGQFSSIPIQRNQLDAKATKAIATAVTSMVMQVLKKDYTLESCTTLITNYSAKPEDAERQKILEGCRKLVLSNYKREAAMADREAAKAEREAAEIRESCSAELGNKINEELTSNPTVRPRIRDWLKERTEDPLLMVLSRCRHARLREELYKEFFSSKTTSSGS